MYLQNMGLRIPAYWCSLEDGVSKSATKALSVMRSPTASLNPAKLYPKLNKIRTI
jgi:hypothetical protein